MEMGFPTWIFILATQYQWMGVKILCFSEPTYSSVLLITLSYSKQQFRPIRRCRLWLFNPLNTRQRNTKDKCSYFRDWVSVPIRTILHTRYFLIQFRDAFHKRTSSFRLNNICFYTNWKAASKWISGWNEDIIIRRATKRSDAKKFQKPSLQKLNYQRSRARPKRFKANFSPIQHKM